MLGGLLTRSRSFILKLVGKTKSQQKTLKSNLSFPQRNDGITVEFAISISISTGTGNPGQYAVRRRGARSLRAGKRRVEHILYREESGGQPSLGSYYNDCLRKAASIISVTRHQTVSIKRAFILMIGVEAMNVTCECGCVEMPQR